MKVPELSLNKRLFLPLVDVSILGKTLLLQFSEHVDLCLQIVNVICVIADEQENEVFRLSEVTLEVVVRDLQEYSQRVSQIFSCVLQEPEQVRHQQDCYEDLDSTQPICP